MASRAGCGFGSAAWSASSSCASATRRYSARSVCHHPTAPTLRAPLAPCTARSPTTANLQTVLSFSLHGVCSPALTPGTAARTHGRDLDSPAYSATAQLRQLAEDPTHDVRGSPAKARLTCGFAPWLAGIVEERLFSRQQAEGSHGGGTVPRLVILGHDGMGGCSAYADLSSGLAIAVLKNAYSPKVLEGTPGYPRNGRVCALVDDLLRQRLGLIGAAEAAAPAVAPRSRGNGARRRARSPAPR